MSIIVDEIGVGKRLDVYILECLKFKSRSLLKKYIRDLEVNSKSVKSSYICKKDDVITFRIVEETLKRKKDVSDGFDDVLFEDENFYIVNKKIGQLVYPFRDDEYTYVEHIRKHLVDEVENFEDTERAGVVHRLDRDTDGILILVKTVKMSSLMINLFSKRKIYKEYIVLVKGNIFQFHDIIDLPIARSKKYNKRKVSLRDENAKEAITEYQVVDRKNDKTLLKVVLHTGRTHQIRLHFSYIGHPVIGDKLYSRDMFMEDRLYLSARKIMFEHPLFKEEVDISLDIPYIFMERLNEKN